MRDLKYVHICIGTVARVQRFIGSITTAYDVHAAVVQLLFT